MNADDYHANVVLRERRREALRIVADLEDWNEKACKFCILHGSLIGLTLTIAALAFSPIPLTGFAINVFALTLWWRSAALV